MSPIATDSPAIIENAAAVDFLGPQPEFPPAKPVGVVDVEQFGSDATPEFRHHEFLPFRSGNELSLQNNIEPETVLDFDCSLFIPGSKRQKLLVTKLGRGTSTKLFYADNADRFRGQEFWLRAEEVDGRRILNYRWRIGRDW